jgi:precorrin-2/cobalt-factor-2 C20-methyltransferase
MSEHRANGRSARGILVGIGVGPGDPELMTLKAMRALREADLVVHFAKSGATSHARAIAAEHLKAGVEELPLYYPLTREVPRQTCTYRDALREFYDAAAARLAAHLDAGRNVAVVCEGDPLFYGSYMHLHVRLSARYPTQVIAGVTGMSGCWSAAGAPIAQGDDVLVVLPATLPEAEIERRLKDADAAVVMKLGSHLPKIRGALARLGRLERAIYVERGSTKAAVMMRLADKRDDDAPYFAIVLVPGWEKRA